MNVTAATLSNQNSARRLISSDCWYLLSGSVIVVPPFAEAEKARERFAGGAGIALGWAVAATAVPIKTKTAATVLTR
jgi:hypothetical protein